MRARRKSALARSPRKRRVRSTSRILLRRAAGGVCPLMMVLAFGFADVRMLGRRTGTARIRAAAQMKPSAPVTANALPSVTKREEHRRAEAQAGAERRARIEVTDRNRLLAIRKPFGDHLHAGRNRRLQ